MDFVEVFIAAVLTGLSFLLLLQMGLAFSRTRNLKVLFLTVGFMIFFIEGLFLLVSATLYESSPPAMSRELMVLNLLILLLFYMGTVKR